MRTLRRLRRGTPPAETVRSSRFGASDVDSFDVRHRFPNTHFLIAFYFNELTAAPAHFVLAYPLPIPEAEAAAGAWTRLGVDIYCSGAVALKLPFNGLVRCGVQ
jgi:hypothetical protein